MPIENRKKGGGKRGGNRGRGEGEKALKIEKHSLIISEKLRYLVSSCSSPSPYSVF